MNVLGHSGQSYDAWFTDYPSTHKCAGQTVEVVTRAAYDRLAATTPGAVDAALRDVLEEAKRRTPQLTGDQLTGDRVAMTIGYVVIDRLRGQ